jgi:hypothetical protein
MSPPQFLLLIFPNLPILLPVSVIWHLVPKLLANYYQVVNNWYSEPLNPWKNFPHPTPVPQPQNRVVRYGSLADSGDREDVA